MNNAALRLPMRPDVVSGDRPNETETDAEVARLEREVLKLGARCRAREHALERLAGAVLTLRRANGALTEENSLLRLELERLRRQMATEHETVSAPQGAPPRSA